MSVHHIASAGDPFLALCLERILTRIIGCDVVDIRVLTMLRLYRPDIPSGVILRCVVLSARTSMVQTAAIALS